jgi:hypothetical protein
VDSSGDPGHRRDRPVVPGSDHLGDRAHHRGLPGGTRGLQHLSSTLTYADPVWFEATDGGLGKIDEATTQTGRQYVVVDTGFWIFGKKRLIPAGMVTRVDHAEEKVHVSMTKDQIKQAG